MGRDGETEREETAKQRQAERLSEQRWDGSGQTAGTDRDRKKNRQTDREKKDRMGKETDVTFNL